MKTNPRQRLLILAAFVIFFALIYPLSRFLEAKPPPCFAIVKVCRSQGLQNTHSPAGQIYRECLDQALATGELGSVKFTEDQLERCRETRKNRSKRSAKDEPAD